MVQILLMLGVHYTQDSKKETLFCDAHLSSGPSLFFSSDSSIRLTELYVCEECIHRILKLKICSVVFLPVLDLACFSAVFSSAWGLRHDFARMTDEAGSSVILAELYVALFESVWKCKDTASVSPLIQEISFYLSKFVFSIITAVVACAILKRSCCFEPSSETIAPRYLKLVTVSSVSPFTLISLWVPLVLFVNSMVFSALTSILDLVPISGFIYIPDHYLFFHFVETFNQAF